MSPELRALLRAVADWLYSITATPLNDSNTPFNDSDTPFNG